MFDNTAGAIYGVIAVGALLSAEGAIRETYAETVGAVVVALLLYWLAHAYAELLGRRLDRAEKLTLSRLGKAMGHELPILVGAAVPLVALLAFWAAGRPLSNALTAGVGVAAAMLVVIELWAGHRAELSGFELVAQSLVGGLLAVLVIGLRLILHH
jgi:Na+/H+ antiporter NhaC